MKKICFLLCFIGVGFFARAQTNPFPTTDSLERFINRWIRNSAVEAFQNLRLNTAMIGMLRFVQNSEIGSGVDTMYKLNDSTVRLITHAPDTFDVTLRFAGSGGGANANVGSGFRWVVVGTQNIKTLRVGYGVLADSTTNANSITIRADTSGANGLVTRTELLDSTDITTQVESPIYVKLRSSWPVPDTLAIDTTLSTTRAWLYKVADSLISLMATAGITQLTGDVTAGPGSGSVVATIANNAVTTAKIADNNVTNAKIVAFSPFPAERSYGKIYEKSFWNNINEDLQVGPSGNNTISVSNGFITMTATGFSAANLIRIISDRPSCLNKFKLTTQIGIGTLGANAADIGSMLYSTITHSGAQFGYMGFIQTSTSGTSTVFIYDQARSSQKATATGFTYASNDIVQFTWELRDTALLFTAHNLTSDPTGANAKTATYNFGPNSSAHILPNSYNWAIYDGSGTGGTTRTLRYVKIESTDIQYPNLLILGNSKTKIGYATFWNGRFGMQLNATYPNTVINAGGAERMLDMIARLDEITQLSPSQVLLADIASNSLRAGVSITDAITQYEYIVSRLEGAGIRVLHCVLPEDSTGGGLGQTAWNAWLSARYASTYINTYGAMSTGNIGNASYLHADKIHLIQAGNDIITSTVIASGLVQTISLQRRASYRTNDRWFVQTGDSTHFSKKIFAKDNNVPRWDFRNQSLTSSMLYMDSIKFIMSTSSRPALPVSNLLGSFEGSVGAHGTAGAFVTYGRDNSAQSYSPIVNSNTTYILRNGTEVGYIGSDGRTSIGNKPGTQSSNMPSMFQVRGTFTFASTLPLHGVLGNFDSSTISITASGGLNDISAVSIAKPTITSTGAANSSIVQTFRIAGAPINGTNFLGIRRYALRVEADTSRIDGQVVLNNTPTAFGAYKILTKSPNGSNDSVVTQVNASTFATQSALNDTAAAIRAAGGGGGDGPPNYILQFSNTQAVTVSNTAANTTIYGTGNGSAGIDGTANITAGTRIVLKGSGTIDTDAAVDNDMAFNFDVGSTTLGMNVTGLATGLNNSYYEYEYVLIPVAIGSNQDAIWQVSIFIDNNGSPLHLKATGRFPTSFTTTGTVTVNATVDWVVADAQNNVESNFNTIELFKK